MKRGLVKESSFYMAPELFKRQGEQNTDNIWNRFTRRVGTNNEVKRYKFDPAKVKRSCLNPNNGQSNSLYFGAKKYFAFYSQSQHEAEKSIQWREFNKKLSDWNKIFTACRKECKRRGYSINETRDRLRIIMKQRPYYDGNVYGFKDRWGKNIDITDVFDINIYPNLDVVISMIKREWPDAQFAGVVVKFNKKGDIVKN